MHAGNILLTLMSLWFYGYFNPWYLFIIGGSILLNYAASKLLNYSKQYRKIVLTVAIVLNIAIIFYYKYFDFFIWNINTVFKTDFIIQNIVLPLGISFFTFQQISYVVDSYHGRTKDYGFVEYALFVSFFPQLVAGPIVLHSEMIPQFRDRHKRLFDSNMFLNGCVLFSFGLFKKVIIADYLGRAVNWGFGTVGTMTALDVIVVMLSYTFQIYFDFSGYSDMATGIASMFNISLPINFNSPYKALSIPDFWKRWHMTLTRFLTTYIYIPLGGNRKGTFHTYRNILIVFLVSGIWHGANYTFILWGIIHGVANTLCRMFQKYYIKIPKLLQWLVTFVFLNITWLLFRAKGISQYLQLLKTMLTGSGGWHCSSDLLSLYLFPELKCLYDMLRLNSNLSIQITIPIVLLLLLFICLVFKNNFEKQADTIKKPRLFFAALALSWCIVSLGSISTFLYFNF